MKNTLVYLLIALIFLISSCSNDDFTRSESDLFLDDALTSITNDQLLGKWTINKIKSKDNFTDVTPSIAECGRDFFEILPNENYRDYLFDNSNCTPKINMLTWSLLNGVVAFTNGIESDLWVITELSSNKLVFKFRLDSDSNGKLETFEAVCSRYDPPTEIDVYSRTFYSDFNVGNNDKILFKWDEYKGYNEFLKYEVYRVNTGCSTSQGELISVITDKNQTSFIDGNPPNKEELCYFFKIYTNKGVLGESEPITVSTDNIIVPSVKNIATNLNGSTVNLNWNKYEGYYFSHYEIEVRNYSSGTGGGYKEDKITEITNVDDNNLDIELPYFENPVFVVHVYNIFGKRNTIVIEAENQISTNFTREEILPINFIKFYVSSKDEEVLYFSDYSKLYRYNYSSHAIEKTVDLDSSSIVFLDIFNSSLGQEVIVNTGNSIKVYDINLNFKYSLILSANTVNPEHLIVNEDGYWLVADRSKLYSFKRTNNELSLISESNLYDESFCCSRLNIINIKQNRILVGNKNKSKGIVIAIDSDGVLNGRTLVDARNTSEWDNTSLFSGDNKYVLDLSSRSIYSTETFNKITNLNQNYYPSGISLNGSLILGTNNSSQDDVSVFHEKKVRVLNYPSLNEQVYESKGYPLVVFENYLGQIISISKSFIGGLDTSDAKKDLFIEVIN